MQPNKPKLNVVLKPKMDQTTPKSKALKLQINLKKPNPAPTTGIYA